MFDFDLHFFNSYKIIHYWLFYSLFIYLIVEYDIDTVSPIRFEIQWENIFYIYIFFKKNIIFEFEFFHN